MSVRNLPVALVTGAGSGIGRAVARKLACEGWRVGLLGRRESALAETADGHVKKLVSFPCNVGDRSIVDQVVASAFARFGRLDALINAAGINTPRRSLGELSHEDYHRLLETNLHGALNLVLAVLPIMRAQGCGAIVNINSDAGLRANAKAGAAYVMSKFGLAGLTQSINAEERDHGVRACSIFPGDVDTPLLDQRPVPPPQEARARMLQPSDIAECVWLALSLPPRAIVEELLIRPR